MGAVAKCIDNTNFENILTIGNIYKVKRHTSETYKVVINYEEDLILPKSNFELYILNKE